jgi:hypothetical protein
MKKTHWKKLNNPDYIGAYELMRGDENIELVVKIGKVSQKIVKDPNGREELCIVAELEGHKPMIVNATNAKAINKAHGSPYIEDWQGKEITLYVEKVKAFGDVVDALRVKQTAPKPKANPTMNEESFKKAFDAVKNGAYTYEKIASNYQLTPEQDERLKTAV